MNFITVKANGTGLAIVNEIENTTKLNFAAFGSYHYFILDEVDLLGKEGMESLKAVMNKPRTIFIMTTNDISSVDKGVVNRSYVIHMMEAKPQDWLPLVKRVIVAIGAPLPPDASLIPVIASCKGSAREICSAAVQVAIQSI